MAMFIHQPTMLLFLGILLQFLCFAKSQLVLGVNYGQEMNEVPNPTDITNFLKQTSIKNIRFLGVDTFSIKELAKTDIGIVISIGNGDVTGIGDDPVIAAHWVQEAISFFYPDSKIMMVTIGNEVITAGDSREMELLVPAMQNVQNALNKDKFGAIKVSTIFSMNVLAKSDPPSATTFDPKYLPQVQEVVKFLRANGSPFMIDMWPYFAYQNSPTPELLKYCLFQDPIGKVDPGNNHKYMNMFDAMVDAVRTALNSIEAFDIPIVVSATGWPSQGDDAYEHGATLENAKAYNGNLIKHLTSMVGTPLSPNMPVNTFISSLFNEDARSGPKSVSSFGLFNSVDFSPIYDAGLVPSGTITKPAPVSDPMADSANWFNLKTGPPDGVIV